MISSRDRQDSAIQLEGNDDVSRLAQQDKVYWYSKPHLRLLYLLMFLTCIGAEVTGGATMVIGLQTVTSWLEYYHHPRSVSLGLMISMHPLGCIAAVPFAPVIVDKIGRRYPILLAGMISIFGAILQGCALDFMMFLAARFILGFANVICIVAASSLIGELSHPKERAIMGSLFNTSYDLGAVAAAAVTLGTFAMTSNWGWRIPSFLQLVSSVLQVSFIWFVPESPRWLISRGRGDEAYAILAKYHGEGDRDSEFVKAEYAQIESTLEAELKIAKMDRKVFATPGMRRRVIVAGFLGLFTQWSGAGLTSYFLPLTLDSIGIHNNQTKNIINIVRLSLSLMNGTVSALLAPQYPRRRVYLACTISLFVVFTAWTVASAEYSRTHSKISAQAVLALIFLYNPAYNLGFTALTYTFLVELFPFHVRARGIAVYQWCCRGGAFLNQLMDPIGIEAAGWRWYIVYCVWNAFQIVFIYLMFPETSGRTLEELTLLYGDDREAFRHAGLETLRPSGTTETYGTMEDHPRRVASGERG